MNYSFLLFFYFLILDLALIQAKSTNYKKLEEIEKKLLINKEVYLELLKVEKEAKKM